MQIGELAHAARCSAATIRYYERVGLLPLPERTEGNFRRYDPTHVERLRTIRGCRAIDLSLDEIRALLAEVDEAARDCAAIDRLIEEHLNHVDERVRELEHLRDQLETLRARCRGAGEVASCGVLTGLASLDVEARARVHT